MSVDTSGIQIEKKAPEAPYVDVMEGAARWEVKVHDHGLVALVDVMPRLVPEGQTADMAIVQAARMLQDDPDFVVTSCPTCTMALQRDFLDLLKDNPVWAEKAMKLAEITIDISCFIADHLAGAEAFGKAIETEQVTYHDSCHLKRGAGVWEQPRRLIAECQVQIAIVIHVTNGNGTAACTTGVGRQIVDRIK